MRIIGGKNKGRKLLSFEGEDIRPTSDRAKEALFNIFQDKIYGCSFLDGFCGSGSVGIEAISRGAKTVVFTDVAKKSVELTKKNLSLIKEDAKVYLTRIEDYLKTTNEKFDIIFLDPPYALDLGEKAIEIISSRQILNEGGYVILEKDVEVKTEFLGLERQKTRKYGKAYFNIYKAE